MNAVYYAPEASAFKASFYYLPGSTQKRMPEIDPHGQAIYWARDSPWRGRSRSWPWNYERRDLPRPQTNLGRQQLFAISTADQRQHIYTIGKTGSGKTTLLRNLIVHVLYNCLAALLDCQNTS